MVCIMLVESGCELEFAKFFDGLAYVLVGNEKYKRNISLLACSNH